MNSCAPRISDAGWLLWMLACCFVLSTESHAQGLTGLLIATVTDEQGGVISGAVATAASPALIGGPMTLSTNEKGQLRFAALPPGVYALEVVSRSFVAYRETGIVIGAGSTIERVITLQPAGLTDTIVVEGSGPHIEARHPGFGTRFGPSEIAAIPTRRSSMFDFMRAAPGVSGTSPSSGTVTTVSVFGSGANENMFLMDGTNFTCPCNGIARSEPGVDFIQEVQIQSIGASVEFGGVQGGVINIVTRHGSERLLFDSSYYAQTPRLTSQGVKMVIPGTSGRATGYSRVRYHDATTNIGGPAIRDRLWFFAGYQYLRDYDSQPGTDARLPRTYEQDKWFSKLTWRLAPAWTLVQSVHYERWFNPDQPTITRPFEATLHNHGSVPAITFGHLTHTYSPNTVWEARAGRFVFSQEGRPATGRVDVPGRTDSVTRIASGAPLQFGDLSLIRTTGKMMLTHYRPSLRGADHEVKIGAQAEQGEHRVTSVIPTGRRFVDRNGRPSQQISRAPFHIGGQSLTAAAFVMDQVTLGPWVMNAGLRFEHSRAISQDLHAVDLEGRITKEIVNGLGTLYTWNILSPRLGFTTKLSADGRTIGRASYGRFHQGVLTGEFDALHPGSTPETTTDLATGRIIGPPNLRHDPAMRSPFTDQYSIGLDRQIAQTFSMAIAYVHKKGRDYIGWSDTAGQYRLTTRTLADGRTVPVFVLDIAVTPASARRFLLTNQDDYSFTYDGVVLAFDKRRSHGWQASGSYTFSRAYGLQPSALTVGGPQVSTVAPPIAPRFGRDPNDLTNARGRLANDRPHMLRLMASADVPRIGVVAGASFQYLSGKPWAAMAVVNLPQNREQRVLIEPRGSRRFPAQTLLDVRLSRTFRFARGGEIDILIDVLNALNESAGEGLVTDTIATETAANVAGFGQWNVFVDPRRAMIGLKLRLGRRPHGAFSPAKAGEKVAEGRMRGSD